MRASQFILVLLPLFGATACEGAYEEAPISESSDRADHITEREGLRPSHTEEKEVRSGNLVESSFDASDDGDIVTVTGPACVYSFDSGTKYFKAAIETTDYLAHVAFQLAWRNPGSDQWSERSLYSPHMTVACDSRYYSGPVSAIHFNSITVDRRTGLLTANVVGPSECNLEMTVEIDDGIQEFRLFPVPILEPGDIAGEFNFELTSNSF